MKTPKFTDAHRHAHGYADAAETSKEGYLRRKFARIRAEQATEAAKPKASVREIKRKAAA